MGDLMIIAVAGFSGSGKNTLGKLLADKLGYRLVDPTFKDIAKSEGISLMELQKRAENDKDIDKKFDAILRNETSKGNCVVSTWLGPWIVDADVRIKVYAPPKIRAERVAKRDSMSFEQALNHINERDDNNRRRYMGLYNINIDDIEIFDGCLNSAIFSPEQLLDISLRIIKQKINAELIDNSKNR